MAKNHLTLVQIERDPAEQAARLVETWAQSRPAKESGDSLQIGQVAQLLDVSRD